MNKKIKNSIIGTALLTAMAGLGSLAVTSTMVSLALDREMPKPFGKKKSTKGKISGAKKDAAQKERTEKAEEALLSLPLETVEIKSFDGERLVGHYLPCENAKRTLIAMHGWRSSFSHDFAVITPFWRKEKCNILYVEQRGQNNSGGNYMGFGLLERYDCRSWVDFITEREGNEMPIYLCGISMGASTVLMTAGLSLPENVKGIVADCGFTSPDAIWQHVLKHNLKLSYGVSSRVASYLCRKKIQIGSREYSTVDAMKECKVPVLFVHGTDDTFVPIAMTYENYKACAAKKYLLVVPGAGHGMSYCIDQAGYEKAVKRFFTETK